ncbi:efflux transporter outer membrane subunit [Sphingomonas fuzhouensis]|uniref:efflux transporter outer membrane subunit n=1 Tax=Sphingomonas fuzhouensis TaxID=3106033 RepID=UPI002AFEC8CA|nr:efflux transporter outer membrane subunit [Sphingomonas sp. SGZ-02]
MTRRPHAALQIVLLLTGTASLAACGTTAKPVRPIADFVPQQWPAGAAYPAASGTDMVGMTWQALATDAKMRHVIGEALIHNQDLAAAVANVASARAQYRTQRSYQFPTLAATGSASDQGNVLDGNSNTTGSGSSYAAQAGVSSFELDLFGRLHNLSRAAFAQYLATDSGARSTRLSIVAETARAYVALAADRDRLTVAEEQVTSSRRTVTLNQDLHDQGLVSGSDVADSQTVLAQAQSDVASYTTQVAQDRNALELLTGHRLDDTTLPTSLKEIDDGLAVPAAGLSSAVLLSRPDVVEAERQLEATGYNVAAARAAFFPKISLTGALGLASTALSALFSGASSIWSASANASLPILGGTNRGNLDYAIAQRDYYLATYRKAAQTAYREVSDALARRGTIGRQRDAQQLLVASSLRSYRIADARYREGVDSFLTTLVSQRTLYSARQTQLTTILADLNNRITLYQVIGADPSLAAPAAVTQR